MRVLLFCLSMFAAMVAGFLWFYSDKTVEQRGKNSIPSNDRQLDSPTLRKNLKPKLEVNSPKRNVTPGTVLPAPVLEAETLERLPAVKPPPPPERPPEPIKWTRPNVISAGIIQSGKTRIILADIKPIPLDETCSDATNSKWPCGMLARTEMRQFVRGRTLECSPIEGEAPKILTTRCSLGNYDMSAWLVLTGWAIPKNGLFEKELKEAKQKQRGQWRGLRP